MLICRCARVTAQQIRVVVRMGADSEEDVGDATRAGTYCGLCLERIAALIQRESARRRH
jgi:bacterioferritin-associated ferredoxin